LRAIPVDLRALADVVYPIGNIGGAIASGSSQTDGMLIAPCSIKTLAAVAHGFGDNLLTRAADVMLKERRKLVLMVREAPLTLPHIRAMELVTESGGIVMPPVPAFYLKPQSLDELVTHTVARALDVLGFASDDIERWDGSPPPARNADAPEELVATNERGSHPHGAGPFAVASLRGQAPGTGRRATSARRVLMVRETPLTVAQLRTMRAVTGNGRRRDAAGPRVLHAARRARRSRRPQRLPRAGPVRHRRRRPAALGWRARRPRPRRAPHGDVRRRQPADVLPHEA
jgi:flavin prenyltransferase